MRDRKECGCGPKDKCTVCTPAPEFWAAFVAAVRAQIADEESAPKAAEKE